MSATHSSRSPPNTQPCPPHSLRLDAGVKQQVLTQLEWAIEAFPNNAKQSCPTTFPSFNRFYARKLWAHAPLQYETPSWFISPDPNRPNRGGCGGASNVFEPTKTRVGPTTRMGDDNLSDNEDSDDLSQDTQSDSDIEVLVPEGLPELGPRERIFIHHVTPLFRMSPVLTDNLPSESDINQLIHHFPQLKTELINFLDYCRSMVHLKHLYLILSNFSEWYSALVDDIAHQTEFLIAWSEQASQDQQILDRHERDCKQASQRIFNIIMPAHQKAFLREHASAKNFKFAASYEHFLIKKLAFNRLIELQRFSATVFRQLGSRLLMILNNTLSPNLLCTAKEAEDIRTNQRNQTSAHARITALKSLKRLSLRMQKLKAGNKSRLHLPPPFPDPSMFTDVQMMILQRLERSNRANRERNTQPPNSSNRPSPNDPARGGSIQQGRCNQQRQREAQGGKGEPREGGGQKKSKGQVRKQPAGGFPSHASAKRTKMASNKPQQSLSQRSQQNSSQKTSSNKSQKNSSQKASSSAKPQRNKSKKPPSNKSQQTHRASSAQPNKGLQKNRPSDQRTDRSEGSTVKREMPSGRTLIKHETAADSHHWHKKD